jgi:hypothetical protein
MIVMPVSASDYEAINPIVKKGRQPASREPRPPKGVPTKTKADLIADEIHAAVASAGATPDTSPKPTNDAMAKAIHLIGSVKPSLLGTPDVEAYYGEIHLTWQEGRKQVILMCSADRDSLIHHHERVKGSTSKHGIEKASAKRLAYWLRWLHE